MLLATLVFTAATSGPVPVASPGALAPRLTATANELLLSWIEPAEMPSQENGAAMQLRFSSFDGQRWSQSERVVAKGDVFANWADTPSVTRGGDGQLYAHWLQKSARGKYAYDVQLAWRGPRGWTELGAVHSDGTASEHGFVSVLPTPTGVRIFWLDGRQTPAGGPMTLRTARVEGARILSSRLVDERVCDCCGTAAVRTEGGARVVYRNRSYAEVRDLHTALVSDDRPRLDGAIFVDSWTMPGCPVNGPALDASDQRVVAAWFTGAKHVPTVKVAFQEKDASRFGPPTVVELQDTLGRVDVVLDQDGALVSSLRAEGEVGKVQVRRVTPAGQVGPPLPVTETVSSRQSGFPQLERLGQQLVFVWTHVEGGQTSLRFRVVPIASVPAAVNTKNAAPMSATSAQLPALELQDASGAPAPLKQSGPVLVHLWASWCPPCVQEMPALLAALKASGIEFILLSVDTGEGRETAKALTRQWGASRWLRFEARNQAESRLRASAVPSTFLFDSDGEERARWIGQTPLPSLKRALSLVQSPPPAEPPQY